jgi:hypothetical protein
LKKAKARGAGDSSLMAFARFAGWVGLEKIIPFSY